MPIRRIIVRGWRFLPHSYAIINQFQLLEMLDRPDLEVFHQDVIYEGTDSQAIAGLFDESAEAALRRIPTPPPNLSADATLRIYSPFNLTPSTTKRTCVFGSTEWGIANKKFLRLIGESSLSDAHRNSDAIIITPSNWSRDGLIRSGADPSRVVVVPHGADPSIYKPLPEVERTALRRELGWEGYFIFLHIGAMTSRKGIYPLLQAFAAIIDSHPEARLVLKGADYIYESWDSIVKASKAVLTNTQAVKVGDRIRYTGKSLTFAEIARLYQAADAYVSPYLAEGFNLPVLEAAACGLPVICTKGGSTDDFTNPDFALQIESKLATIAEEGETLFFLAPNTEHLIALMREVIEQPEFRVKASQGGPKFVAEHFTWKHVVDQLVDVLVPANSVISSNMVEQPSHAEQKISPIFLTPKSAERTDSGVANNKIPRPRIIVEGWRFFPHSYAIVNQFQLLEMLKRPEVEVFHKDIPYGGKYSQPKKGLLDKAIEAALRGIPSPTLNQSADATLRIYSPFNLTASTAKRTCVFGTTEWGIAHTQLLTLMSESSLGNVHRNSDTIIVTPSHWSREGFIRSGAEPSRVVVVPLGVDTNIYKPLPEAERAALRRELGWEGYFIFLNIGAMTLEKGIDRLLKAFAAIVERYPDARLVLKGSDYIYESEGILSTVMREVLTDREAAMVSDRLAYTGKSFPFSEMANLYQAADAYVSPYRAEGFNLPVLEAAACGLPVICTKGGPTDDFTHPDFALQIESEFDLFPDNEETLFVVVPSLEHLIVLMQTVIEQQAIASRARQAAPKFVAERFTWKHVVDQLLEVLVPSHTGDGVDDRTKTSQSLRDLVAAFPFWYDKITPGIANLNTASYGVPEDLTGKRVLDVSDSYGYWCFEALKRGAKEAIAIDDFSTRNKRDRRSWVSFDLCRQALGLSENICKRLEMSVYNITEEQLGRFDVIFFFGKLHQLRYPLLALDRLSAACDGELYLESPILDDYSPYQGGMGHGYAGKQMVMEFYPKDEYGGSSSTSWVPTLYCLAQMVRSAGFSTVKAWKLVKNPTNLGLCRGLVQGSKA